MENIVESTTNETMENAVNNVTEALPEKNKLAVIGGIVVAGAVIGGVVYLVKKVRGKKKEKQCLEAGEDVEVTESEIKEDED